MKNLYALNSHNHLIHIDKVDKANKEKYTCLNCGQELIARKGDVNAHHFSHKKLLACSFESYLHKLGKRRFYEEYTDCLTSGSPFELEYHNKRTCISCRDTEGISLSCSLPSKTEVFNLISYFDLIFLEKSYQGFVPDLLLASSKHSEVLFVEIAVTHFSSKAKLESGIRIIEIYLEEEGDLDFLKTRRISSLDAGFCNFEPKHFEEKYVVPAECKRPIKIFGVLSSGRAVMKNLQMHELVTTIDGGEYRHFQLVDPYGHDDSEKKQTYSQMIRAAYLNNIPVRNCNVCVHCRINTWNYDNIYRFYCNKHEREFADSSDALECSFFTGIAKK